MGQQLTDYIHNLNCETGLEDIISVEHRSNNSKRDFLFCNKIQGKHIPVDPRDTFGMLDRLIDRLGGKLKDEKVLVIGFAETATAIASYIASHMDECVYYMQTTREDCKAYKQIADFSEEHSHATEQKLFGDIKNIPNISYILFIDDELTTGKTILNIIKSISKVFTNVKFGVASICNWQDKEHISTFNSAGIDRFYLLSGNIIDENKKMNSQVILGKPDIYGKENDDTGLMHYVEKDIVFNEVNPFYIERTGRVPNSDKYDEIIIEAFKECEWFIDGANNVLILGTEEFMYIPLMVADLIGCKGVNVKFHATTRSPIDVTDSKDTRITSKVKLHSAYDINRDTYLYNLNKYDKVVVVTDCDCTKEFMDDLASSLVHYGNNIQDIMFLKLLGEDGG